MDDKVKLALSAWVMRLLLERYAIKLLIEINDNIWTLKSEGCEQKISVAVNSVFYNVAEENIPHGYCPDVDLPAPGIEDKALTCWALDQGDYSAKFDIFGLAYWSLNRLEEITSDQNKFDDHGRFRSDCSHAVLNEYFSRPLVDEWLYNLLQIVHLTWPNLSICYPKYKVEVSHDVDSLLRYGAVSLTLLAKKTIQGCEGESKSRFIYAPLTYLMQRFFLCPLDPENTFEWIMDVSDNFKLRSMFFFIACKDYKRIDKRYNFQSFVVKRLLARIKKRGHFVGLHPSLNSTNFKGRISYEQTVLDKLASSVGLQTCAARMHYLQWTAWSTVDEMASAGIKEDWSLGYADRAGFRAGTCHTYEAFDPVSLQFLGVKIHPLIIMDRSLTSKKYMNLSRSDILELTRNLSQNCKKFGGTLSILWHNGQLASPHQKKLYKDILEIVTQV